MAYNTTILYLISHKIYGRVFTNLVNIKSNKYKLNNIINQNIKEINNA